ncbi:MAG: transposase [Rhodobacteraceae bacterium]|nr:transposase [Paracoccaceae bacterium]
MCDVRRGRAAAGPHAGARGEPRAPRHPGGERKSDPKDAVVIAELARTRPDLRAVEPPDPLDAEIRLLVSRRRELVTEQTRRAARLRDLLSGLFPALERRIDPTTRTGLVFLSHYAAPEDIRAAGAKRITRRLTKAATGLRAARQTG